jgi:hypothetical protein
VFPDPDVMLDPHRNSEKKKKKKKKKKKSWKTSRVGLFTLLSSILIERHKQRA